MVFSIDPNVKGAISESFDKSHLSDSFDVPAGCEGYGFTVIRSEVGVKASKLYTSSKLALSIK